VSLPSTRTLAMVMLRLEWPLDVVAVRREHRFHCDKAVKLVERGATVSEFGMLFVSSLFNPMMLHHYKTSGKPRKVQAKLKHFLHRCGRSLAATSRVLSLIICGFVRLPLAVAITAAFVASILPHPFRRNHRHDVANKESSGSLLALLNTRI